jgi:hypothetical protein
VRARDAGDGLELVAWDGAQVDAEFAV